MKTKPKVALINDTSLYSRHFGCHMVGQVLREQFMRVGLDLVLTLPKVFDMEAVKPMLSCVDLVVVNGEGSIHHGRNLHLIELAKHYPSVLVNCVYQENPTIEALKKFLLITARESLSTDEIRHSGADCKIVPDLIFASSLVWSFHKPQPTAELGVTDSVVKEYRRIGPFKKKLKAGIEAHRHNPCEILYKLCEYRRICAGRFHAAVLAIILDIPFSAWESNTWKIRGMLKDMGLSGLCYGTRTEALENVPNQSNPDIRVFAIEARKKIEATFDEISEIAHGIR